MKTRSVLLGLLAGVGAVLAQAPMPGSDFQSAKIYQSTAPVFPESLVSSHRNGGAARVVIDVDPNGRLTDWLVLSYTNRLFADAAVAALREWSFEPARWMGEPVSVCITLTFNFEVKGVVISITPSETLESLFPLRNLREVYGPCTLRDLDRIPIPVHSVSPAYPKELADRAQLGEVTVEFYIDERGAVRLPHALGRPSKILASLAVAAVEQWRFEPPTSHGRPVLVCAQQVFRFKPTAVTATQP